MRGKGRCESASTYMVIVDFKLSGTKTPYQTNSMLKAASALRRHKVAEA